MHLNLNVIDTAWELFVAQQFLEYQDFCVTLYTNLECALTLDRAIRR